MLFDRLGFLWALLLLVVVPICVSNTVMAQAENETTAADVDEKNCDCRDGECKDGQCINECTDEAETVVVVKKPEEDKPDSFKSTHRQSACFRPKIENKDASLSTFRLREDGNLVACVWSTVTDKKKNQQSEDPEIRGFVHVYSPEFELIEDFGLPFRPSALDLDGSGNMFVAGEGKVSRMTRDGEIEIIADSPTLAGVDMDALKEEVRQEMEKQLERNRETFEKQIEAFAEQIAEIEEVDEEERSRSQIRQLKSLKSQLKNYEGYLEQQSEVDEEMIEWRLQSKSKITAVAVTENDVFVATGARKGSGYEVYRMNHELEDAERVLKGLRGCCGQMDIYAQDNQIYVAENTKFSVGIYDRDGGELSRFGKRLRKDNQGFGSCCNPMNVICCPNGDILTAESSIGKIKRFSADGEMIEYVGRARIGGGCKHVAIGFDAERDRYYVQYEDKHQICVLMPNSSVADTSDPRIAAFTKRLTAGTWQLAKKKTSRSSTPEITAGIGIALGQADSGEIFVKEIFENSPVEQQGRMNEGDILVAVGDVGSAFQNVSDMTAEEVTELLRGSAGVTVRVKYRKPDSKKTRRTKFRRVGMELADGKWVINEEAEATSFSMETLSRMKSLQFYADGSVSTQMEVANQFGGNFAGNKWLATKVENDTLYIDIESAEDMIMYRLKVKFVDDDSAEISVTYDGIGEEGEFRNYKLIPVGNNELKTADISADPVIDITEIDEK